MEANIITGLGLDNPRSQTTNLQKTTGNISNHHRKIDDIYAVPKAVQRQVQGQWTRWLQYVQQYFSWASLMTMPANLIPFCLAFTFDALP